MVVGRCTEGGKKKLTKKVVLLRGTSRHNSLAFDSHFEKRGQLETKHADFE